MKTRFSQVFLRDGGVIRRIVGVMGVGVGDVFFEVGPGIGALTFPIMESGARVIAVEIDGFLCMALRRKGVDVVCGDYLKVDTEEILAERGVGGKVRFFSSVPYHITHDVILKVFSERHLFRDVHLILQREVAQKLLSAPKSKSYGPFSIITSVLFEGRYLMGIPNRAFSPVPKVHSALIRLIPREENLALDVEEFLGFLKVPFKSRRKKIKNTLRNAPKDIADLRPEDVPPDTWLKVFESIS